MQASEVMSKQTSPEWTRAHPDFQRRITNKSSDEIAIVEVFEKLEHYHVNGDAAAFCSLLHPNFTEWGLSGEYLRPRAPVDVVQETMNREIATGNLPTVDYKDLRIDFYGVDNDFAVATCILFGEFPNYKHLGNSWRWTTILCRENGIWKVVHVHSSALHEDHQHRHA
jgi:hypothetical protein